MTATLSRITLLLSCAIGACAAQTQPRTLPPTDAPGTDIRTQILHDEAAQRWAEEERARTASRPRATTTLTSASMITTESAVSSIIAERCARETACNNIASVDECKAQLGWKVAVELGHSPCA